MSSVSESGADDAVETAFLDHRTSACRNAQPSGPGRQRLRVLDTRGAHLTAQEFVTAVEGLLELADATPDGQIRSQGNGVTGGAVYEVRTMDLRHHQ